MARAVWEPVRGVDLAALDWDSDQVRKMIAWPYSPEVELEWLATGIETRTFRGADGVLQALREWIEPFKEYYAEPLDFIEVAEFVVVPTRQWGIGQVSGARTELAVTHVYEFRDNQIVRLTDYDTTEEALEAVGVGA